MNILIVYPRLIRKNDDFYYMPLGIAYISASLKSAGRRVTNVNLNQIENSVFETLRDAILKESIDVVLTGGLSGEFRKVKEVVAAVKAVNEHLPVVLGGGIISSEPIIAMEALGADIGVIGEGEITIVELIDRLERGHAISDVDGIVYRSGTQYVTTAMRKNIPDISTIAWPDYEGFGYDLYLDSISKMQGFPRYVQMIASRSCPYSCTFCYHPIGKTYRQRILDDFFSELDFMLSKYRIEHLNISDELFSLDRNRTAEFCRRIKERVDLYRFSWDIQIRVDHVDNDLLAMLKESGCKLISYGIESANDTVLKSMRKNITVKQIEKALDLTYKARIQIQGNFIFGDEAETWTTAHNTLEWWRNHPEYQINLTYLKVYPGTPLYKRACERGIIEDRSKFLRDDCPLINVSQMSQAEFASLDKEMQRYQSLVSIRPESVRAVGLVGSGCKIQITCGRCSKRLDSIYHPFRPIKAICPGCGVRQEVDDAAFETVMEDAIRKLFAGHTRVAIWGTGEIAAALFDKSATLKTQSLFIIDSNPDKQTSPFFGCPVSGPRILTEKQIEVVIIASHSYADEIEAEVKKIRSAVRCVKINDLSTF